MTSVAGLVVTLLLAGCGGDGGGGGGGGGAGVPGTVGANKPAEDDVPPAGPYLNVSPPEFYYSTLAVGTDATQEIEIQNRGANRYPLDAVVLRGDDADDFRIPVYGEVILEPAQAIRVPVTFAPLDEGRKLASLEIDYRTIVQAAPAASRLEQTYYEASDLAQRGRLNESRAGYEAYLDGEPATINRRRAAIRVPIVQEAQNYGEGDDSRLYLQALEERDKDNPTVALLALDALMLDDPDSFLADDAQYLKGYVALMDLDDPALALREFRILLETWPDSTYYDTALYGEAIAQERLGNDALAADLYRQLRERHTGVAALGVRLPKDDLVARLWFGRASAALDALNASRPT